MKKLSVKEIETALGLLKGWSYKDECIGKTFLFKDFIEAFGFMGKMAIISEKLDHHPNWSGVYNKVVLRLSTHDAGGVTKKDIEFAEIAENYTS